MTDHRAAFKAEMERLLAQDREHLVRYHKNLDWLQTRLSLDPHNPQLHTMREAVQTLIDMGEAKIAYLQEVLDKLS